MSAKSSRLLLNRISKCKKRTEKNLQKCEKDAHLSKFKEWTQRHVEYSERETLLVIFQDWVPGEQIHPKQLQEALYCPVHKSLPGSLLAKYYRMSIYHPSPQPPAESSRFPVGLFKICHSWDWSNCRDGF
jgi:hypothetical protein